MLPYSCPPYSGLAVPAWSVTSRLMLHLPVTLHAGRNKGNTPAVLLEREQALDSSRQPQDRFLFFIPAAFFLPILLYPLRCQGER